MKKMQFFIVALSTILFVTACADKPFLKQMVLISMLKQLRRKIVVVNVERMKDTPSK